MKQNMRGLISIIAASVVVGTSSAYSDEFRWTGNQSVDWAQPENWQPESVPTVHDVVTIPSGLSRYPDITAETFCRGVILETDAQITVDAGGALYVIGPGDLDEDWLPDAVEAIPGNMRCNVGGPPNFDNADSDGDGLPDAWSLRYFGTVCCNCAHDDPDGDGFDNLQEFTAGTDPLDANSHPPIGPPLSANTVRTLALKAGLILAVGVLGLRRRWRWRGMVSLLIMSALLAASLAFLAQNALAAKKSNEKTIWAVDFTSNTLQGVVADATEGDTIEIHGDSLRPWSGESTYVTKAVTVTAVKGSVYLGGMTTQIRVGVSGEGALAIASDSTDNRPHFRGGQGNDVYPAPISATVEYGSRLITCYLGEKFSVSATAENGWGLYTLPDVTAKGKFQATPQRTSVVATFTPPGAHLWANWTAAPNDTGKAGDTLSGTLTVTNVGPADTTVPSWTDAIYISRDNNWDSSYVAIIEIPHSDVVVSHDWYQIPVSVTIPDLAPGTYYVLGAPDIYSAIDADKTNAVASRDVSIVDASLAK